jgi:hypothetical protein
MTSISMPVFFRISACKGLRKKQYKRITFGRKPVLVIVVVGERPQLKYVGGPMAIPDPYNEVVESIIIFLEDGLSMLQDNPRIPIAALARIEDEVIFKSGIRKVVQIANSSGPRAGLP